MNNSYCQYRYPGAVPSTHPILLVSIDEACVDVVGAFGPPEGLQAHPGALVGQDVHQAVLELVHGQVGAHEARRLSLDVR